jgi:hypothetical protein
VSLVELASEVAIVDPVWWGPKLARQVSLGTSHSSKAQHKGWFGTQIPLRTPLFSQGEKSLQVAFE